MKTRFTQAAIDRQNVLDYINANPGARGPEITAAMGWNKSPRLKCIGADRLRDMTFNGELSRTPVSMEIINKHGHPGVLNTYAYTALKTVTRSEADVRKSLKHNLGGEKRERVVVERAVRDPNRKPIPNQGGQGNLRHEIRRGCSLS